MALNASNQVVTSYTGTVSFSSGDTTATVAATKNGTASALGSFTYQFTGADAGAHTFFVTFDTAGQQSLTVSDSLQNTGSVNVKVVAPKPWLSWLWW